MKVAKFKNVYKWKAVQQVKKIGEEVFELVEAMVKGNTQEIIAEGLDVIQAVFTLFFILGVDKDKLKAHMSLHRRKLENRHEEGIIDIEEWVEL